MGLHLLDGLIGVTRNLPCFLVGVVRVVRQDGLERQDGQNQAGKHNMTFHGNLLGVI
jgi:hypothetical protein